jgi:hypothetical protein
MGDRDTWSEADLAARAVANGMLRDDALLRKMQKKSVVMQCRSMSRLQKLPGGFRWPRGQRADLMRMARRSLGLAVRMSLSMPV